MINVIFFLVALIQLGIGLYGLGKVRRFFNNYALLVLLVVFALAYDNLAVAAGAVFEAGPLLKSLNAPRYWLHALFLPTTIIAAFGVLRLSGSARGRGLHAAVCTLATLLIGLGVYTDIVRLSLAPQTDGAVLRYVNTYEFLPGPPIPALVTILAVIGIGAVLWRRTRFPWLFAGGVIMFATAPLAGQLIAQNIGEIAFAAGLVLAVIRFSPHPQEAR